MAAFWDQLFCFDYVGIYLICLAPTIVAYSTISTCYQTAFDQQRFPKWVQTPWISFTGVNAPESRIYVVGFTLAGISLFIVNYIFTHKVLTNKRIISLQRMQSFGVWAEQIAAWHLSYNLVIASIALAVQAWINVPNQMLIDFLSPKLQTMKWYDNWPAIIHIGSAAIFLFGAIFWHNVFVCVTFNHRQTPALKCSFYYKLCMIVVEYCAGACLFCDMILVCYVLDPYKHERMFQFGVNLIGVCQYIATATNCLFWISYAYDYHVTKADVVDSSKKQT